MTFEGFVHQPGGCSPVKLLGFTCLESKRIVKKLPNLNEIYQPLKFCLQIFWTPSFLELPLVELEQNFLSKQVKPSSFTGEQPPGWC